MAVDKKDFDIDPGSGVAAAPADEAAAEGSDAKPLRKKRTGLRVPSDNVPRPDGRTGRTLPPGEVGAGVAPAVPPPVVVEPIPVPGVVTIMPGRPGSQAGGGGPAVLPVATPPPLETPLPVRAHTEDLEVDVELIEDDGGHVAPAVNGSGPHPRGATVVDTSLHYDAEHDGVAVAGDERPRGEVSDGVPASVTHELSWNSPDERPPVEQELRDAARVGVDSLDDLAGEPTVIGPPPTGAPTSASVAAANAAAAAAAAATQPSMAPVPAAPLLPSPAARAASAPAVPVEADTSDSGPTVMLMPAPAAAPAPSEAPQDEDEDVDDEEVHTVSSEEAEELSPTELEEVESGPMAMPRASSVPSGPSALPRAATAPPVEVPAASSGPSAAPTQPVPSASATTPPPAQASTSGGMPVGNASPTATGPRMSVPPPPPPAPPAAAKEAAAKAPPPPPAPKAAVAAAAAAAAAQPSKSKKRKGKAWFEEIFDEDYLRTLPFLTPQATQREAAFIAEALGIKPGMQVLDLGCGYGRHAMELAARGHHVVGLDLSLPLLIRGADEAQRRGLNINFVHGDMRELTFDAQFDGAYCVFSTFGYFDDETNKRVAVNLARALKPGAKLVIDVLNRDYVIADLPTRVWWEGDGCVVLEEVDFNYFTSRVISNRSVVFEDGRQLEQEISMRSYSLHELGKLLHTAGFRVTEVSGGLATRGRFFGNESRQIIVVAEKREGGASGPATSPPPVESK